MKKLTVASVAIAAFAFVFLPDCFGEPARAETSEQLHARLAKLCPPRPETAARFRGEAAYPAAAKPYRDCAKAAFEYMTALPAMTTLVETGEPDNHYQHNAYPSKTHAWHIRAMLAYAKLDPSARAKALRFAAASAEYLATQLEPADAPLAYWPPTYGRKPLKFDPRTDGPEKGNEMVGNEPAGAVRYRGEVMLVYPAEVGIAFAQLARETGERRWLDLAARIAGTYLRLRRADGSWPLKLKLATGETVCGNPLVSLRPLELFEALHAATGERRWKDAADAAFVWLEAHPLRDWNWDGQFEDIRPAKPYTNPTKHNAIDSMMYILRRFPGDRARLRQARDLLRFCEDRFVCWEKPANHPGWEAPSVLEQYSCFCPIDASAAKMIRGYLAMYRAEGRAEDLAKARTLANTVTRLQKPSGRIPTFWTGDWAADVRYDWLNCMASGALALLELADCNLDGR